MQGKKEFEGSLFCDIDLMEVIGEDHLLVRLNDALDLGWIRQATKDYYSHTGRPSVDPVALVKMMLIGYLYGIPSERRLAEEVRLNIAYRWFAGYNLDEETPDHSVFLKSPHALRPRPLPARVQGGALPLYRGRPRKGGRYPGGLYAHRRRCLHEVPH